eukprot:Selendium_serpulae@DN5881_c0_g1_i14.p1
MNNSQTIHLSRHMLLKAFSTKLVIEKPIHRKVTNRPVHRDLMGECSRKWRQTSTSLPQRARAMPLKLPRTLGLPRGSDQLRFYRTQILFRGALPAVPAHQTDPSLNDVHTLKRLIRKGIPDSLRPAVWTHCLGSTDIRDANPKAYDWFVSAPIAKDVEDQINLDVRRTFPNNKTYKPLRLVHAHQGHQAAAGCPPECPSATGERTAGLDKLTRVLHAYAAFNPTVSYCQSMNFVAAILLLVLEEDLAFWSLVQLISPLPVGNIGISVRSPSSLDMTLPGDSVTSIRSVSGNCATPKPSCNRDAQLGAALTSHLCYASAPQKPKRSGGDSPRPVIATPMKRGAIISPFHPSANMGPERAGRSPAPATPSDGSVTPSVSARRIRHIVSPLHIPQRQIALSQTITISIPRFPYPSARVWDPEAYAVNAAGYYGTGMRRLRVDLKVLDELVKRKVPKAHAAFEKHGITCDWYCSEWFLCFFCTSLPVRTTLRVWDAMMYEGSKVLFRVALAVIREIEKHFNMATITFEELMIEGKNFQKTLVKHNELIKTAFLSFNKFSRKEIQELRSAAEKEIDAIDSQRLSEKSRRAAAASTTPSSPVQQRPVSPPEDVSLSPSESPPSNDRVAQIPMAPQGPGFSRRSLSRDAD